VAFTNEQLAVAIREVSERFFVVHDDELISNQVLRRLFENLIEDVRGKRPPGTTFAGLAKLAREFDTVTSSMGHTPKRLAKRLCGNPVRTAIDGTMVELEFFGPDAKHRRLSGTETDDKRLYLEFRCDVVQLLDPAHTRIPSPSDGHNTVALRENESAPHWVAETAARYIATTVDLLFKKRPRKFMEALRGDTSRYLSPLRYLGVSIALAIALGCSLALLIAPAQVATSELAGLITGAWLISIVIVVCLVCTFAPAVLVCRIFRIPVTWRDVLTASCYSSALLPGVLAVFETDYFRDRATIATVLLLMTATVSYEFFAVSLLAWSVGLSGWRSKLFISTAVIAIVVVNGTGVLLLRRHRPAAMAPMLATDNGEARVRTLPDPELTAHSARLSGNSVFPPTQAWFELDDRLRMRYSVAAVNGVGFAPGLQANTLYYYRYVAKDHDLACYGEVRTFTTLPE